MVEYGLGVFGTWAVQSWLMEVARRQSPSNGSHLCHTDSSNRSRLCRGGKAMVLRTCHAKLLGSGKVRGGVLRLSLLPSLLQDVDVACFGATTASKHCPSSLAYFSQALSREHAADRPERKGRSVKNTGWRLKIRLGALGLEPLHRETQQARGSSSPTNALNLIKPSPKIDLPCSGSA